MLKIFSTKQVCSFFILAITAICLPVAQAESLPVPTFQARYDVRINGISVANAEFSLSHKGNNEYLYEQNSQAIGFAAWFKREKIRETSHWKMTDQGIQPVSYQYSRNGGSDDREVEHDRRRRTLPQLLQLFRRDQR